MLMDSHQEPSIEDVWQLTRDHFASKDAANLDETLIAMGNQRLDGSVPVTPEERLVYAAWSTGSASDRRRLAHLFMRTVGHQEFNDM